jgi:hypothetical protein
MRQATAVHPVFSNSEDYRHCWPLSEKTAILGRSGTGMASRKNVSHEQENKWGQVCS